MRRTRSRKTHKRHAKRHTHRRGGNGNGPSAINKKNNSGNPLKPINPNAPFNYETYMARVEALEKAIGPLPPQKAVLPIPGQPSAFMPNKANNGFKAAPALPGSAAELASKGPVGAPIARQKANNRKKVTTKVMPEGSPGSPFF